jgi:hypothetical protein
MTDEDLSGTRLMVWASSTGLSSLHMENDDCAANPCPSENGSRCKPTGYVMFKEGTEPTE